MSLFGSIGSALGSIGTGIENGFSSLFGGGASTPAIPSGMSTPTGASSGTMSLSTPSMIGGTSSSFSSPALPSINASAATKPSPLTYSPPVKTSPAIPSIPTAPKVIQPATTPAALSQGSTSSVLSHPYVTTPSGAIVDPNTGALISPPGSQTGGGAPGATTGSAPTNMAPTAAPATPTLPGGTPSSSIYSTDPSNNPLFTSPAYTKAMADVNTASTMSPAEIADQTALKNLTSSFNQAFTNAQGQPIPLDFITGQQKNLQTSETNLAQPYTADMANLEAQRQMQLQGATTALNAAQGQLAGEQAFQKPVALGYGGAVYQPGVGVTATTNNPGSDPLISAAIQNGQLTPDMVTRYGAASILSTLQQDPTFNFVTGKGNAAGTIASLTTQGDTNAAAAKAAATSGATYKFDPATGTYVQANPGVANTPSKTVFGTSPSSAATSGASAAPAGITSSQTSAIQNFLISQGYQIPDGATGNYGPETTAAVAAWQAANGVDTSGGGAGTFGPKTQAAAAAKGFNMPAAPAASTNTHSTASALPSSPAASKAASSGIAALNPSNAIDGKTLQFIQTGEIPTGTYPAQADQVRARAQQVIPGFNPTIAKANAAAIADQTKQMANTTRAITAADSNFGLMIDTFKNSGVNDSESPAVNQLKNAAAKGYIGNSDVINFTSAVSTLQTEYAAVLGRGGEVTDSVRAAAKNVIDGNYSMTDLSKLHDYIDKESANVISSYNTTIKNLSTGGTPSSSSSGGSSSGGSTYKGFTLPN